MNEIFNKLNSINVSDKIEKKGKCNYLSWSYAWAEVKKIYPTATYGIEKNEKGLPYFYDESTGYMVYTWVEIESLKYEMWLPVLSSDGKTMFNFEYAYDTKYKKNVKVPACTMFDINKTLMRCLTKNLAMFGLGLYIYSGEDLPISEEIQEPQTNYIKGEELTKLKKGFAMSGMNEEGAKNYIRKTYDCDFYEIDMKHLPDIQKTLTNMYNRKKENEKVREEAEKIKQDNILINTKQVQRLQIVRRESNYTDYQYKKVLKDMCDVTSTKLVLNKHFDKLVKHLQDNKIPKENKKR